MPYDSEEEKKLRESIAAKTRLAKEFIRTPGVKEKLIESLKTLAPVVDRLHEKARYEKLSEDELKLLDKIKEAALVLKKQFEDVQLLIENDVFIQSQAWFFHVKKLAEEGNEDAKKVYAELLPSFRQSMGEGSKKPEENN